MSSSGRKGDKGRGRSPTGQAPNESRGTRNGARSRHDANGGPPPPEDEEARLDQRIRSLLGAGAEGCPPEQWRGLREHARLPLLYTGQFVAFRDHYEGEGEARQLARREVLHAAASLEELHERLAGLPESEQQGLQVVYVEKARGRSR